MTDSSATRELLDRRSTPVPVTGCVLWTGSVTHGGYGTFQLNNIQYRAHRASYELSKGKIPDGLHLDHLCRVPACINPDHLEAVTPQTNLLRGVNRAAEFAARKTCVKGHDFVPRADRGRRCPTCKAEYDAQRNTARLTSRYKRG